MNLSSLTRRPMRAGDATRSVSTLSGRDRKPLRRADPTSLRAPPKQLRRRAAETHRQAARSKLRETTSAIERLRSNKRSAAFGARGLLLYVYERHPPKQPSFTLERLRELLDASPSGAGEDAPAQPELSLQKILLKAQRDYHPDRNRATPRETLSYSPMEWEVICLCICQEIAHAYDKLFKSARALDR